MAYLVLCSAANIRGVSFGSHMLHSAVLPTSVECVVFVSGVPCSHTGVGWGLAPRVHCRGQCLDPILHNLKRIISAVAMVLCGEAPAR